MFTVLNIANPVTYTVGTRIVGKTSGAAGYTTEAFSNGSHYIYIEQVNGVFSNGEILQVNGRDVGTIDNILLSIK